MRKKEKIAKNLQSIKRFLIILFYIYLNKKKIILITKL